MKIPVMLCFDDRILMGAGVTVLSLLQTAAPDTQYHVHVLHSGLKDKVIAAFERLVQGTRHEISFLHIPPSRIGDVPKSRSSWTEIVYYRLLIPELFPQYSKVIYSDVDVCFMRDMAEVFSVDLEGYDFGGVAAEKNLPTACGHRHFPENPNQLIFMSGFLLMNLDKMRQSGRVARFFEVAREYRERLKCFDLDILNLSCNAILPLPFDYIMLEDVYETSDVTKAREFRFLQTAYTREDLERAKQNPAIIHYAGHRGKPWQRKDVPPYYQAYLDKLPEELRVRTFRDFRKRLFTPRKISDN